MKTIEYVKPEVIVCLNGDLKFPEKIPLKNLWLAVDGAANVMKEKNLLPSYIIGDLDSVDKNLLKETTWKKIDNQDTCDFEKALQFILKKGWNNVAILGFQGKDLDHTLNNWSVLMRYGNLLQVCVIDNDKWAIPLYNSCEIHYQKGSILSLIPQPNVKISTKGLQWELTGEFLTLGIREGARNKAIHDTITIEIHEGSVMLILEDIFPGLMPVWK